MSQLPILTDRTALARNRARANPRDLFLQAAAIDEAQDRLAMVNRTFKDIAVVTPFPQAWSQAFPRAHVVPDDETLPLEQGAHDLVIHAMCLHWANDPVGQLVQCRRALRPDGLALVFCMGGQTLFELRAALAQAEIAESGGLSPRILPMAEIRDLGALLQRAGFALPVADSRKLTAEYRDLLHMMRDLRGMGEGNAMAERLRRPTRRAVFARAETIYRAAGETAAGGLPATFEIISLTGWAPAAGQPQPLRPGSARTRLADVLGTTETPLKD